MRNPLLAKQGRGQILSGAKGWGWVHVAEVRGDEYMRSHKDNSSYSKLFYLFIWIFFLLSIFLRPQSIFKNLMDDYPADILN
ncbi:MAG: hypothetical protein A2V64_11755 [Bacteroidetes bacterium RBG_13_43_22]|nr:MAG: hypothetical protein A2V64_11755 [Bacteroidetes bacterium RBG_13_43_22]